MNKKLFLAVFAVFFLCLTGCNKDEPKEPSDETIVSEVTEELLPVMPDIVFTDDAEEGGEITEDMIPPGALADIEDNGILDPNAQFKVSKKAQAIRRIVKQDVYGRELSDDFYCYRNILNSAEKLLYDQIYANCVENDPSFNIQSRVNHTRAMDVLSAVLFDNPDLFWVEPSISYSYGNDGYIIAVTLKFYDCARNLDAFKKVFYDCADSVLEQAMKLENDVLKVKYVHDVLTYINDYVINAPMNQSAYSAIVNKKTVCAGYAAAFTYYMQRLGIPSLIVVGYAGESHAWNLVKLYGEYYEMDVTWNDPVGNPPNRFYYDYFNITSSEINKTRNRDRMSASNIPLAYGTRYSYQNFFRNSPGSNFSSLSYGKYSVRLPFIYSQEGAQTAALPSTTPPASVTHPEESSAEAQPSITLVNYTGEDIWWVYVSLSDDDSWGDDRLGETETLDKGESITLKLPYSINTANRYDIMLEDSDENSYTKINVAVTANARIVFTVDDLDGDPSSSYSDQAAPLNTDALRDSRNFILNSMRQWNQCRSVALTQTQGNAAIYGRNDYSYKDIPNSLGERIKQIVNANEYIEDINISESGGWVVITQNNAYWDRINSNLGDKILEADRNKENILSVAFNDRGDWILVTNKKYSSSNSDIQSWLLEGTNQRGTLFSVNITDDGIIAAVHDKGWRIRGNAPQDLINALNSTNLTIRRIKINDRSWFFADENGNYSCSL